MSARAGPRRGRKGCSGTWGARRGCCAVLRARTRGTRGGHAAGGRGASGRAGEQPHHVVLGPAEGHVALGLGGDDFQLCRCGNSKGGLGGREGGGSRGRRAASASACPSLGLGGGGLGGGNLGPAPTLSPTIDAFICASSKSSGGSEGNARGPLAALHERPEGGEELFRNGDGGLELFGRFSGHRDAAEESVQVLPPAAMAVAAAVDPCAAGPQGTSGASSNSQGHRREHRRQPGLLAGGLGAGRRCCRGRKARPPFLLCGRRLGGRLGKRLLAFLSLACGVLAHRRDPGGGVSPSVARDGANERPCGPRRGRPLVRVEGALVATRRKEREKERERKREWGSGVREWAQKIGQSECIVEPSVQKTIKWL